MNSTTDNATNSSASRKWQRNKLAFDKWNAFLKKYPDNRLYDYIEKFFLDHVNETLERKVVEDLESYEKSNDRDGFMQLLGSQLEKLDWFSRNYLYYKWVKMFTLGLYTPDERKKISKIPIVPFPNPFDISAITTTTKRGHVIMISFGFSMLALSIFQALAKCSTLAEMSLEDQNRHLHEAADKVITYVKCSQESLEETHTFSQDDLNRHQVEYADIFVNQLHYFVLLHEYNHVLLGHLDQIDTDLRAPLPLEQAKKLLKRAAWGEASMTQEGINVPLEKSNNLKDLEADQKAMELLANPNNTHQSKLINNVIANSLFVYHYLQMTYRIKLGFSPSSLKSNYERLQLSLEHLNQGDEKVAIFKECLALKLALEKVMSE